jgi:CRP-like cAMP-binding protein
MRKMTQYHEYLRQMPLFAGLDDKSLDAVGQTATSLHLDAGTVLIREGARSHDMFVTINGTLEVTRNGEHVADIESGGFVGELGLLTRARRNATVTAKTDVELVEIDGRSFSALLADVPSIAAQMLPVVAERSMAGTASN